MINLEQISSLPIEVTNDFRLKFNPPLRDIQPAVRTLAEMVPVLMDPSFQSERKEMYYMYRNIHMPEHVQTIRDNNIRYDITVTPPTMLGQEFNKMLGHYHPYKPGLTQPIAYPEVYEVLHGEALFLLQKTEPDYHKVLNVLAIRGKAGDKIIYPPNYGHIMVNTASEVLVTANWCADKFVSLYEPIKIHHGMAYYVVSDEVELFKFVPNSNYQDLPPVRMIDTKFMSKLAISGSQPMYQTGVTNPESLDFLNNPEKYIMELAGITS